MSESKTDSRLVETGPAGVIRVGIADDYPVVLRGVESIIGPCTDMRIIFSVETIQALMEQLKKNPVDILLCDYTFEDDTQADGLDLLGKLQRFAPTMRVIFFSGHAVHHIISSAMKLGASGFVGKSKSDFVNLPQAIRSVNAGNIYLPPSLSAMLLEQMYGNNSKSPGIQSLSTRELAVAKMICEGMSIIDIATRLHRSPKTISNQKLSAMKKLGAVNDVDLSRIFREIGK
jgi:two-component system capsular synthesis response regulator RcsB